MRIRTVNFAAVALLAASLCACAGTTKSSAPRDLTFIHISDTHVGPYLEPRESFDGDRSDATFGFMEKVLGQPQPVFADGGTVTPPSFVVCTGDVTEYGFPGATLDAVDKYYARLHLPVRWTPGNHDDTWVSRPDLFRARQGGICYHYEKDGVHMLGINSATLQEPIQSIGEEDVEWMKEWAQRIPKSAPVFVLMHHPPNADGWASEYDLGRLMEPLRDHDFVALLVGHHHSAKYEKWSGYDVIHGGSTFSGAGANDPVDGFGVLNITDTRLHAAYRFKDDRKPPKQYVDRALAPDPARPNLSPVAVRADGDDILLSWKSSLPTASTVTISEIETPTAVASGTTTARIKVSALINGRHWGKVTVGSGDDVLTERYFEFALDRRDRADQGLAIWRTALGGGVKGKPLLDGKNLIVGVNNETLQAVNTLTGKVMWKTETPGEVLGSPVRDGAEILVATAEGYVLAVDPKSGKELRRAQVPTKLPLYASPLVVGDTIIIGGADADLFALDRNTFAVRWTNTAADYSIEMPPIVVGDSLVYNAWDGFVHSANAKDGAPLWKTAGPANQKKFTRYLAPADYSPIVLGDRIYTTDRGYASGIYGLDGAYIGPLLDDCTALSLTEDRHAFLARRLTHPVCRVAPDGKIEWESTLKAGRLPAPPVEAAGKVYIVTRGILYVLNGANGQTLWSYQVTPGLYVMPEPVVEAGVAYVVGLDGVLTAVRGAESG
ncbi:hypothetical protein BH09SUM1_BH09SUM1_22200 [soil metagenome]